MSMTDGVLTVLPAPEGYVVNFENPPQIGNIGGYFVTGFGLALASAFLFMRLYTRIAITRNFGIEDGNVQSPVLIQLRLTPLSCCYTIIREHFSVARCSSC